MLLIRHPHEFLVPGASNENDDHTRGVIAAILGVHRYPMDRVGDGVVGLDMATQSTHGHDLIAPDVP